MNRVLLMVGLALGACVLACSRTRPPEGPGPEPSEAPSPSAIDPLPVLVGPDVPDRDALWAALQAHATLTPSSTSSEGGFRVASSPEGWTVRGPDGVLRQRIASGPEATAAVVEALAGHAAQRDQVARVHAAAPASAGLEVELRPFPRQSPCVTAPWTQACPNEAQRIPLCTVWTTWVRNTGPDDLWVEAFVLRADGTTRTLQGDAGRHRLAAGGDWLEAKPDPDRPFAQKAGEPVGATEGVLVVGYPSPDAATPTASLHLPYRVVVDNVGWTPPDGGRCTDGRESTVDLDFDPYLAAAGPSLQAVLTQAKALTDAEVPYRQHDWSQGSDDANLEKGIDCSRAIWYAFTRAGLDYAGASDDDYLATFQMFERGLGSCRGDLTPEATAMTEHFVSCLQGPYQTGDVLVWQGVRPTDDACFGHTVMVVDSDRYLGWGSHGWATSDNPDVGVEVQMIGAKTWEKWDRKQYALKACWRHRDFLDEPVPTAAGLSSCDPDTCAE